MKTRLSTSRIVDVYIQYSGANFGAHIPLLPGCVATASRPTQMLHNIQEAMQWHIEAAQADGDPLDPVFDGPYSLQFHFDPRGMLQYLHGFFTHAGLEKITGIHQKQLQHYASGLKKPRKAQTLKIEQALHQLGAHLQALHLEQ